MSVVFSQYLDTLFVKDPQAGMDYHELQVKPVYCYNGDDILIIQWNLLIFSNLPITRIKSRFPSSVKHCNFIPHFSNSPFFEPIFVSLGGSKTRDATVTKTANCAIRTNHNLGEARKSTYPVKKRGKTRNQQESAGRAGKSALAFNYDFSPDYLRTLFVSSTLKKYFEPNENLHKHPKAK